MKLNSRIATIVLILAANAGWAATFGGSTRAGLSIGFFFEPQPAGGGFMVRAKSGIAQVTARGLVWKRGGSAVSQQFPGSTDGPLEGLEKDSGETSYRIGNDAAGWREHVPHYHRLVRRGVYPGIDMEFHEHDGDLEFDWNVAPGADPKPIAIRFEGARRVLKDPITGELRIETAGGESIVYKKPRALQESREVAARWELRGAVEAVIRLGSYDRAKPLRIDPDALWIARMGGTGTEEVVGGWVISDTALVVVGNTESADLGGAISQGVSQTDVFVAVLDYQAVRLQVIGGRGRDRVLCVGDQMAGGETDSVDFPVSQNAPQRLYGGGPSDGFVLAFAGGYAGVVSTATFIGGSGADRVLGASSGWFAGETDSKDLPVQKAAQAQIAGGIDAFFGSLFGIPSPTLSYWGGSGDDRLTSVQVSASTGVVRIGGSTASVDFPLLNGFGSLKGGRDGVLLEVDAATAGVNRSRYWGGSGDDSIAGIAELANGNWAFVANTTSEDLTSSDGSSAARGGGDVFVEIHSGDDGHTLYAGYFGGSGRDVALGLRSGGSDLLLFGSTTSLDLKTVDAVQKDYGGGDSDGFWASMLENGKLRQVSYWGGSGLDTVSMAARSNLGDLFLAGTSTSPALAVPVSEPIGLSADPIGGSDGFAAMIGTKGVSFPPVTVALGADDLPVLRASGLPGGTTLRVEIANTAIAQLADPAKSILVYPDDFPTNSSMIWISGVNIGETTITISWATGQLQQRLSVVPPSGVWTRDVVRGVKGTRVSASFQIVARDPETGNPVPQRCVKGSLFNAVSDNAAVNVRVDGASCSGGILSLTVPAGGARILVTLPEVGVTMPPLDVVEIPAKALTASATAPLGLSKGLIANLYTPEARVTSETPSLLMLQHGSNWFNGVPLSTTLTSQFGTLGLVGMANTGTAVILIEQAGKDPLRISIPLSEPAFVVRRWEDVLTAEGYLNTAPLLPRSSGVIAGEPVRLLVGPIPRGVDPRLTPVFSSNEGFSTRVEARTPDGLLVKSAIGLFSGIGWGYTISPTQDLSIRAMAATDPEPEPSAYKLTVAPAIQGKTVLLGHLLESNFQLSPYFTRVRVKVVSGDSRVLVATDQVSPGAASVEIPPLANPSSFAAPAFVLISNTGVGEAGSVVEVPLSIYVNDLLAETWTVRLVPVAIAPATSVTVNFGSPSTLGVTTYLIDPDTREIRYAQRLRRGSTGIHLTPQVSGSIESLSEVILTPDNPVFNWPFSTVALGNGTMSVPAPPGFQQPRNGVAKVYVTGYKWATQSFELAPETQRSFTPNLNQFGQSGPTEIEVASEDPAKLVLSLDPLDPGQASLPLTAKAGRFPTVYIQALGKAAPGEVIGVVLRGPTSEPARSMVNIVPLQIRFRLNDSTLNRDAPGAAPDFAVEPTAPPLQIPLGISTRQPPSATQNWVPPLLALRPGAPPIDVRFTVEGDSGAALLSPDTVTFKPGDESRNLRLIPLRSGDVTLTPAPGSPGSTIHVTVNGPRISVPSTASVGIDLLESLNVALQSVAASDAPKTFTVKSLDPAKLLVSASSNAPGTATTEVPVEFGVRGSVYLHGLASSGTTLVEFSAGSLPAVRTLVSHTGTALQVRLDTSTQLIAGTDVTLRGTVNAVCPSSSFGPRICSFRPGHADVAVPLKFSTPGIVEQDPVPVVLRAGSDAAYFTLRPVSPGATQVSLVPPAGYQAGNSVTVMVDPLTLDALLSSSQQGGASDLPFGISIPGVVRFNAATKQPVNVLLESLDPSLVRLSTSNGGLASDSLTLRVGPLSNSGEFYVTGTGTSGAGQIRVTAPGMPPVLLYLKLSPFVVSIDPRYATQLTTHGPVTYTLSPGSYYGLVRPEGIPLSIASSNPDGASVSDSAVVLGSSAFKFTVTPKKAGSVSIVVFGSGVTTATANLQVTEPTVFLDGAGSDIVLGQYGQKGIRLSFSDSIPQAGVAVTVTSRNPADLVVSNRADAAGGPTAAFTVRSGDVMPSVFLQGGRASGTASIVVSTPGFRSTEYTVSFRAAGFVAVSGSDIKVGASGRLPLSLCEVVVFGGGTYCAPVRAAPQMPPLTLVVSSSDRTVLDIAESTVNLAVSGQDSWGVTARLLRTGSVRVKLSSSPLVNWFGSWEALFSFF